MVDSVSDDMGGMMDELIDEAEGVRERVRRQIRARRERRPMRSRRNSARRRGVREADVEEEFRRDEAAEATARDPERSRRGDVEDGEAPTPADGRSGPKAEHARRPRAADLFPEILGWQPLVLNRDSACGRCERALGAGESAFLGIAKTGLTEIAICGGCASSAPPA